MNLKTRRRNESTKGRLAWMKMLNPNFSKADQTAFDKDEREHALKLQAIDMLAAIQRAVWQQQKRLK